MPFDKGNKPLSHRQKGSKNKRTIQWEAFSEYCLDGGLEKFQEELNKLDGRDFVNAFISLLEFHKPKLARTQITGADDKKLEITVKHVGTTSKSSV